MHAIKHPQLPRIGVPTRASLPEAGIGQIDGRRRGALRRPDVPRGTPHDALVKKVLERMIIDETRRIAF
jgi:hypothetical protein